MGNSKFKKQRVNFILKAKTGVFLLLVSMTSLAQERLVKVNGVNFNVYTKGLAERAEKSPVVVFENGMGSGLGNWDTVIDQIAEFAPVLAYDRTSIGKSDKVYSMPEPKFVNENLHALLKTLDIPPPYVLVGHSFGGVYIRTYAGLYPEEVAGLVFVDPADFTETKNDWNDIFRVLGLSEQKIEEMIQRRLYQPSKVDSMRYGPWSELQVLTALRRNDFAEISKMPLPAVPVYFFVGGKFEVPVQMRSKEYDHERFFHVKNNSNMDRWKKLMYSTGKPGSLIYLTNAGHYIHRDEPWAVIASLKTLMESLSTKEPDPEEAAVKKVIEDFLKAVGNFEIDALPAMFSEKANISGAALKNGRWESYTLSIQEFIKTLKSEKKPIKYREPVKHWTIHTDGGRLASVRADATVIIDDKTIKENKDYFTLIKENGTWKILNGSYVSVPFKD